jgi:hypothetical protein
MAVTLLDDYLALKEMDAHARGRQFEIFVRQLLQGEGVEVMPDVGTARPRQTDLFASLGSDHYLIEAKWRKRTADVGDIDSILSRLHRTEPAVAGLFISVSGFTGPAIAAVEEKRARPVILIVGDELENCLRDDASLWDLVKEKRHHLRLQGRMPFPLVEGGRPSVDVTEDRSETGLLSGPVKLVGLDGLEMSTMRFSGQFGRFVFTENLKDVDWVPTGGFGVRLDLTLDVSEESAVDKVFRALTKVGWASASGRWSIQQANDVWHGYGSGGFLDALADWAGRYEDVQTIHHTEEATYFDAIDGGLFTLAIDISSTAPRVVWHCDLSLQLEGVPLDTSAIQRFCSLTGAESVAGFRSMNGPAVKQVFLRKEPKAHNLVPQAFLVETDRSGEDWATGVWLRNPYLGADLPRMVLDEGSYDEPFALREAGLLMCTLRPGHPIQDAQDYYSLRGLRWTWTSDALLVEVVAEWDYRKVIANRSRKDQTGGGD